MQNEILQIDYVIFFPPHEFFDPTLLFFFADIKVNDLGLDLLHCKYNIPLVQVF